MKIDSVPDLSSSTLVTSAIDRLGGPSSSVIVKIAESSEIVEFVGFDREILAVSLFSSMDSEIVVTGNVFDVSPAAKVSVPDVAT